MTNPDPLITIRGLKRTYREGEQARQVLRGLDLDVGRGECVALLGRSGGGKSTLLNLISGIDRPDAGTIHIDGVELTALDEYRRTLFRRRHIGFVYQFFNLIPTLTVEENLLLPLELNGLDNHQRAFDLLASVGLSDRRASFPDRLSGGEQQRVALVRALVHDPSLVLADEPTGNLDAHTGRIILDLLQRLVSERGSTLLLVTHSEDVAALADRVLHIQDGAVA
ncbi:MAG TPA: ABC transporter ATP-binding protein, partial [Gammaproteobacteria bacterium]|nr:ABC transporter ATP-binding protein [Gammaproteobacteria bacterium]